MIPKVPVFGKDHVQTEIESGVVRRQRLRDEADPIPMADYYPLIARAVAGLENSTGEARRAMYERARSALIAQLRSVEPALSESDITRERLALEEAVRKVESEAAQRTRSEPLRSAPVKDDAPADSGGDPLNDKDAGRDAPRGDITRDSARDPNKPRAGDALRSAVRGQTPNPDQASPFAQQPGAPRPRPQDPRPPEMSSARVRPSAPPPSRPKPPSLSDQNTRGFRDVVHEVNDLGRASTQAGRSARRAYTQMPSPSPQFDRLEPGMENRGADPDHDHTYYNETTGEAVRPQPPHQQARSRGAKPPSRARRAGAGIFKALAVIGVLLCIAGLVIWQLPNLRSMARVFTGPSQNSAEGCQGTGNHHRHASEDSRSRRPAVVAGRAGRAARRAL